MRRLEIDFIKQSSVSLAGVIIVLLGLVVFAVLLFQYQGMLSVNAALEAKIEASETAQKPKVAIKPTVSMSQEQVASSMQHAHQLADFLLLPWMDVFTALEASADPDVAMLGIEPEPKKQVVKIIAEAKDKEHMFDYMKKLEATPQLTNVYLLRHEVEEEQTQHPIRFVVAANWVSHTLPVQTALSAQSKASEEKPAVTDQPTSHDGVHP